MVEEDLWVWRSLQSHFTFCVINDAIMSPASCHLEIYWTYLWIDVETQCTRLQYLKVDYNMQRTSQVAKQLELKFKLKHTPLTLLFFFFFFSICLLLKVHSRNPFWLVHKHAVAQIQHSHLFFVMISWPVWRSAGPKIITLFLFFLFIYFFLPTCKTDDKTLLTSQRYFTAKQKQQNCIYIFCVHAD